MVAHYDPATNAGPPRLHPNHLADLRASGLTDATIAACGFYSETDPAAVARLLNRRSADALVPGLVIPFTAADGSQVAYAQVKPDTPYVREPGKKPAKYVSPSRTGFRAYLPPGTRGKLADLAVSLIVTEGAKKAAAADQHGFPTVALVGVEAWSVKRKKGKSGRRVGRRELITDLAAIPWVGRTVFVIYDSDAATKREVRRAERAIARALRERGATVRVIRLPAGPDGAKVGLDDFLVAHGPVALRQLLDRRTTGGATDHGAALFRDDAELDRLAALALDDPAEFAAVRADLRRGVSLRDLDQLLRPRVDELRAERRPPPDPEAEPTAEAGPYAVIRGVIHRRVATQNGEVEVPLCNFDCRVTGVTTRDDGVEVTRTLTLEGRHAGGRQLPPVSVPADQFAAMTWVLSGWGNQPVVYAGQGTRDHLRTAVQLLSGDAPQTTVYTHTGWRRVGGTWAYLHGGGGVGVDGVAVDLAGPLAGFRLPAVPTGNALRAAVRASLTLADPALAPDRLTIPLFAAVYRAVLGPCDFAVHLFGPTGAFKSELAALAQQHFGATLDARHLPANWMSTANAIEGTLFAAKDAVAVVDDFNPTGAADPAKLHAAADRVFRGLGNGAGRNRMAADLSVRPPRPPRGLVISTGEDVPKGHSCRARLLVLEMRPGDVRAARLTAGQRQAADGVYAAALAGFVTWLAPRYQEVLNGLTAERAAVRDQLTGLAHARTPTAIADLTLGWKYLLTFAREVGAVTATESDALLARGTAALAELAAAQTDHLQAADPVDQFVRLVPAVLLSGQAHLTCRDGGRPDHPDAHGWRKTESAWESRGERIGWAVGDDVYLDPDAAFAAVQRLAAQHREPITMSARTLWRRLHERGVLASVDERGGKTRFTVRVSLAGERVGVLHFHRTTLFPGAVGGPGGPPPPPPAGTEERQRATPGATPDGRPADCPHEWPDSWARTTTAGAGVGHPGHSPAPDTPDPAELF